MPIVFNIIKVLFILVLPIILFLSSSYISWEILINKMDKSGVSSVNDFRVSKRTAQSLQNTLKPFSDLHELSYEKEEKVYMSYGAQELVDCYLKTNLNKKTKLKSDLEWLNKFPPVFWQGYQLPNNGFYQGDGCFVIYVNPDKPFGLDNLTESAQFAEIVVRKNFGKYIDSEFHPYQSISVAASTEYPFAFYPATVFGMWFEQEQRIYLNKDSPTTSVDIGWRLIHEVHHAYASDRLDTISGSSYSIPEETLTEFLSDYIANKTSFNPKAYSPAVRPLLKYLTDEKLVEIYFQGSSKELESIIDSQTYKGAYCKYIYYVGTLDAYGHAESDLYEKALTDPNLEVPSYMENCTDV